MKTYLITGANGFIAKNLAVRLRATPELRVLTWSHTESRPALADALAEADIVFHLAGVNRPQDPTEFDSGNRELTAFIVAELARRADKPLLVLSSSAQHKSG